MSVCYSLDERTCLLGIKIHFVFTRTPEEVGYANQLCRYVRESAEKQGEYEMEDLQLMVVLQVNPVQK